MSIRHTDGASTRRKRLPFLVFAALTVVLAAPAAFAEVYVHLKDGKVLVLPVDRGDIDYIEITPKGVPSAKEGPLSPDETDEPDQSAETAPQPAPSPQTPAVAPKAASAPAVEPTPKGPALPAASADKLPPASRDKLPSGGQLREATIHKPETYRVGPDQKYKRPSALAAIARDGDTIEIEAGVYDNDWASWRQNDLTLKGVGGRARLRSAGAIANGKAIWIVTGNNVTVENIEFSGAKVRDGNGAGIRAEGGKLTIRNSYFHDNEMGILSSDNGKGDITIENSEFARQKSDDPYGHNIYVGASKKFRLTGSYIHEVAVGNQVKSRALENFIAYNRIMDGTAGDGSYAIDLPNCGTSYVIGNVIQQGVKSENHTAIAYGAEGCSHDEPRAAYIVNNTFVNDAEEGIFVFNHTMTPLLLRNNLIVGIAHLSDGPIIDDHNLMEPAESFVNRRAFDYRLARDARAIDKGAPAGKAETGMSLAPKLEYKNPLSTEPRPVVGKLDVGAFEYAP